MNPDNITSPKTSAVKKILFVFFISLVFSVSIYVTANVFFAEPTANHVAYNDNNFSVLSLKIPTNLNFCGEKIPQNDYRIRTALEKEFFANSYWKSNSVVLFNRVQKWFPYIEPILKEEGVPDDFKYMAFIESHLTNATSPAGASGFWQLVPVSARHFGLVVNDEVDERYSVEKATRAACRHIKKSYAIFKNWTLCAAAYNLGINGVLYELKRQETDNYFSLLLNAETGSFVYRILAYKTLFSNPAHFGVKKKIVYYPKIPFHVHKTDSAVINLNDFSKAIGISKKIIKAFNPWLLADTIHNPEHYMFEIRVPKKLNADYSSYLSDLNIHRSNTVIYSSFETEPSASTLSVSEVAEVNRDSSKVEMVKKTVFYIVNQDKEPLNAIADKYSVSTEDLKKWNRLGDAENIDKGKLLTIHYFEPK
ncbi:MAG: transglycosylase SLT domain-containing protein [Bacteroidetes bacterium]|nr:transglycosylase SLT domain-containing protein [Bacteroidota bacterium]